MLDRKLFEELKSEINNIKIFDTHEHLIYETERRAKKLDFFHLFSIYGSTDLISAGLDRSNFEKLQDSSVDLKTKWNIFYPYWEQIKNTNYSEVIKIALKDIYHIDEINLENVKNITTIMAKFNKGAFYQEIIKRKSNIEFILNDLDCMDKSIVNLKEPDKTYFLPVLRLDYILAINSYKKLQDLEEEYDISIDGFSAFLDLLDKIFVKRREKIYALKIGTAYFRNIKFEISTYNEAEKSFQKILKLSKHDDFFEECISLEEIKDFQDFIHHFCIKKAIEYNMPIQIHTGLLEGNINDLRNSNPLSLTNLLLMYRNARFDLFHAGFPYTSELISMVKMYPNAFFNMCWLAGISKKLYMDTLQTLIETIPSGKIFGFGGDYLFVEGLYGSQKIVREILTKVLYDRIKDKYFSFGESVEFAKKILYINPKKVFLKK